MQAQQQPVEQNVAAGEVPMRPLANRIGEAIEKKYSLGTVNAQEEMIKLAMVNQIKQKLGQAVA